MFLYIPLAIVALAGLIVVLSRVVHHRRKWTEEEMAFKVNWEVISYRRRFMRSLALAEEGDQHMIAYVFGARGGYEYGMMMNVDNALAKRHAESRRNYYFTTACKANRSKLKEAFDAWQVEDATETDRLTRLERFLDVLRGIYEPTCNQHEKVRLQLCSELNVVEADLIETYKTAAKQLFASLVEDAPEDREAFLAAEAMWKQTKDMHTVAHAYGVQYEMPAGWNDWVIMHYDDPPLSALNDTEAIIAGAGSLSLLAAAATAERNIVGCAIVMASCDQDKTGKARALIGDTLYARVVVMFDALREHRTIISHDEVM